MDKEKDFIRDIKTMIQKKSNIIIIKFGKERTGMSEINQVITLNKGSE